MNAETNAQTLAVNTAVSLTTAEPAAEGAFEVGAEGQITPLLPLGDEENLNTISLRLLHVGSYNPREYVPDDQEFAEFCDTIRALGVYTPIIIRKVEGKKTPFEVVVGQRRFLGSLRVYGPDGVIPYTLRKLTDEEALALATSENIDRAGMNPVEEAQAAAQMVGKCNGDRAEAAKRLGWRLTTLNDRLKLMACSKEVRKAMIRGEIPLGLGELMSGLAPQEQDRLLTEFRSTGVPKLEEARAQIMQLTRAFQGAIFDQAECGSCAHNSATQQSMFGNIESGYCMKGECFQAKTEAVLEGKVTELKDTYQTIRIIRPGDNFVIKRMDETKLGCDQAKACRSCQNFGAAVSGMPKSLGAVQTDLCYDTTCYDTKAKEQQAAVEAEKQRQQAEAAAQAAAQVPDAAQTQPATQAGGAPTAGAAKSQPAKPAATRRVATVTLTNAIHEFRDKFYRGVLTHVLRNDAETAVAFVFGLLLSSHGGYINNSDTVKVVKAFKGDLMDSKVYGFGDALKQTLEHDPDPLKDALPYVGIAAIERLTRQELTDAMKLLKPVLSRYFTLNTDLGRAFLQTLTKTQIEEVCVEFGIDKKMDKTFKSIIGGKKEDCIKHVSSIADFEYAGKVPKLLLPTTGG